MQLSHEALHHYLNGKNSFTPRLLHLAARTWRHGQVGAACLAVGMTHELPLRSMHQNKGQGPSPTPAFLDSVIKKAQATVTGSSTHPGLLVSSRVLAPGEDVQARWIPTAIQARAFATVAEVHSGAVGGALVCPQENLSELSLFRRREDRSADLRHITRLDEDAPPEAVQTALGKAGVALVRLELVMPTERTVVIQDSFRRLGALYPD